ncbi:MAG: PSD1 and planctomycete cytochrome C domain-containing protein [Acidobacteria bacterium]|nr:PSD1 and planctomycete cytochrome C domain-containing protein [Acidobacteriota bacterium]
MWRGWLVTILICPSLLAQKLDATLFESKIRPVLAGKCYGCHSSKLKAPMGGLVLDTKAGLSAGGSGGKVIVAGQPDQSRLLTALRFTDPHLQMPPTGKLPDAVIDDFASWIASGAVDPRTAAPSSETSAALKGMSIEAGRQWWAFQPIREVAPPRIRDTAWSRNKIDPFVLAQLEAKRFTPSSPADKRTLARRAYIDLVGYKPTYQEVEVFAADASPDAWEKLIDRLLASPQYGERWARHWMDVARYGEDNPTSEATNPAYPFAWRYRDWIIEALNQDVPYDRFVKLQLAADQMPGSRREDLRALGYLGAALFHKDQRLSADVINGFLHDDWDERVDAVSRGLLAMTVACARCHDHKFDPIPTKDYYALAGVFASTMRAEQPLFDVDAATEARYLAVQRRLIDLRYSVGLLTGEASTVLDSETRVARWRAEIEQLKAEMLALQERYPKLVASLERYWTMPAPRPPAGAAPQPRRRPELTSTEPFLNAVFDAAQYVETADPHYTFINYKPGEARDLAVLRSGNVAAPGEIVPRQFLTVLSKGDSRFLKGSGRLELADKIFTDDRSLAARVIVNRVWDWHFGRPLAATPSDFGVQGDKPTHPELLDDLATRFVAHGWSLKWLHREIMTSAAYRQSSKPRPDLVKADPTNMLFWRMPPRRMDIESYRDTLLRSSGRLNDAMYGPSEDVEAPTNVRRTIYGRISRSRLSPLLKNYDFPDPLQSSGGRDLTTTSLQQLFVLNSAFIRESATAASQAVASLTADRSRVEELYRRLLSRDPSPKELDMALSFLAGATLEQLAQVLLSTNEVILWP